LRIVDLLEKNGRGLNLTWEVRDGILHHSKGRSDLLSPNRDLPATLEGQVVRICDRVAYVNHDIDDAIRAGLISEAELPQECIKVLGATHSERITTMVKAIILASSETLAQSHSQSTLHNQSTLRRAREQISMLPEVSRATDQLKNWMFDHVYKIEMVDETLRVRRVIVALFERFMEQPELMRGDYANLCPDAGWKSLSRAELARCVCDYVAGMTDRFASQTYAELFMPSSWRGV
jgi:dGTPase